MEKEGQLGTILGGLEEGGDGVVVEGGAGRRWVIRLKGIYNFL
jgi:hypothetical protein